jgi:hypothetical protein
MITNFRLGTPIYRTRNSEEMQNELGSLIHYQLIPSFDPK